VLALPANHRHGGHRLCQLVGVTNQSNNCCKSVRGKLHELEAASGEWVGAPQLLHLEVEKSEPPPALKQLPADSADAGDLQYVLVIPLCNLLSSVLNDLWPR
jgi:hypothetical protein